MQDYINKLKTLLTKPLVKRHIIEDVTLSQFSTIEQRDEFIKQQLIAKGFNLDKPIKTYKGIICEQ